MYAKQFPWLLVLTASLVGQAAGQEKPAATAPTAEAAPRWDLKALSKPPQTWPASEPSAKDVTSVFYEGLPWQKKPTRVFAYYGVPKVAPGAKVPGMVLVHGGGGTAFDAWVRLWNSRGYAAIAMDTCGCVPIGSYGNWKRHDAGGPPGWGGFDQIDSPAEDQWTYHAIADVVLAHSLLRSLPGVDPERIGVTGISWGGYLTCIASGVDPRFRFAVPVYGCGFLGDNSTWLPQFQKMGPEKSAKWLRWWDPSIWLREAKMPMLWVTGTNDFAYPMDSLQKSYRLPTGPRTLCLRVRMPHGHGGAGENPAEILAFAESQLNQGQAMAKITGQGREGEQVWATFDAASPLQRAELNYTCQSGRWQERKWETVPAQVDAAARKVTAKLPQGTTVYYLNLIDARNLAVSTEHQEVQSPPHPQPLSQRERGGSLEPVDKELFPDLFVWRDTCNVYVLRDGDAALLIDLGDGSVLGQLKDIGVKRVEWVLFTHHHREQCQGWPRLKLLGFDAKVAAPEAERALFERPSDFRKMKVSLGDPLTIHGASYVRPPVHAISVDQAFKPGETFRWRTREFTCMSTPGNSPGGMTFRIEQNGRRLAFSGDVMLDGGKLHTWFDTEWDYGFAAGIRALRKSVALLADAEPAWLLPSHGPVVRDAKPQLLSFAEKLGRLEPLYLRGYDVEGGSNAYQDKVSKPTAVPDVWQVTPHLLKFKRKNFWPNFGIILAPSGRGLVVDCGLTDLKFLEDSLQGISKHFGLKTIDAVIVTHMHGDHFLDAPYLRKKWGAKVWALENMVDKMEHPERTDYAAPIQAYGHKFDGVSIDGVKVDRAFKPGEKFEWEGYKFTVDWMPGQTEFALCLHGQIDGRYVAFTGDNIFGDPENPAQNGHEAMVAHNSAILEEGYIHGAELLRRIKPDVLVGGHSFVMDRPAQFIERFCKWSYQMRDTFQSFSPDPDYRYWFDPFWVRAESYRTALRPGQGAEVAIHVRNFRKTAQKHRIEIHAPPGLVVEPAVLEGELPGELRRSFPVRVKAAPDATAGVRIVGLDVTLDGQRYGEWFDFVVGIETGDGAKR
jgi:glyoxylase-like metal-dependent hydrolase (beta-lactamase superfamily II)/dienelactone hydrolase